MRDHASLGLRGPETKKDWVRDYVGCGRHILGLGASGAKALGWEQLGRCEDRQKTTLVVVRLETMTVSPIARG